MGADYSASPWNMQYEAPIFRKAMREIRSAPQPKVIFNVGDGKEIQAMYYGDCPAYPFVPGPNVVRRLLERGYGVYFVLSDFARNEEPLAALEAAGLLKRTQAVYIPAPVILPRQNPYEN